MNHESGKQQGDQEKRWEEFEAEVDDLPEDTIVLNEGDFEVEAGDADTVEPLSTTSEPPAWIQIMKDARDSEEDKRRRAERAQDADTLEDIFPSNKPKQETIVGYAREGQEDAATTFEMTSEKAEKTPQGLDAQTLDNLLEDAEDTWTMNTGAEDGEVKTGNVAKAKDALEAAKKAADATE